MADIRILADDLTGACDTGVQFAQRGLRTVVTLDGSSHDCDVLVRSTGTRNDPPPVAYRTVRNACEMLNPGGPGLFYKKIDSTLRGPVAAELVAAINAGARTPAILCPAFPEQGRTVVAGELRSSGIRIGLRGIVGRLPIDIRDASTSDELEQIAASALRDPIPMLVGSAGLARAAAGFYGHAGAAGGADVAGQGRVILCIGSEHPVTANQIARLEETESRHTLHRVDFNSTPRIESELETMRAGGVFFCGGDTALYLCRAFGVRAILLEREVLPGVPIGRLIGGPGHGLAVITKSGGFGAPDTLTCVVRVLSGQNRREVDE